MTVTGQERKFAWVISTSDEGWLLTFTRPSLSERYASGTVISLASLDLPKLSLVRLIISRQLPTRCDAFIGRIGC